MCTASVLGLRTPKCVDDTELRLGGFHKGYEVGGCDKRAKGAVFALGVMRNVFWCLATHDYN